MYLKTAFLVAGLAWAQGALASLEIVPGATWTAGGTNQHVQAHGGGIIEDNGVYYWIGENKLDGSAFQSVNCYSSTNLVEWDFVGELLSRQSSGDLGPNRVVERPKVIYNEATRKYVMWMHIDSSSYGEAKTGVATSSSVCGKYNYLGSFQPLGFQSRDMNLFKDDDGSAYLLTEDRPNGLRINRLTDDYTGVASNVYLWPDHIEAPAMFKKDGVYFMFGSQLTATNDNKYSTATKLSGPWSSWSNFAPSGTNTYDSQTSFILGVGSNVMYMGDRWLSTNLMASTYIWLPLTLSGRTAKLTNEASWTISRQSAWAPGSTTTSSEAESSSNSLANGARILSCSNCSGGKSVGYLGGSSNGGIKFSSISTSSSGKTTVQIRYENGDSTQRYATVTVNGQSHILAFIPSQNGNTPSSSSLNVNLNSGNSNVISISGYQGGWAPDVDRLLVPQH
ncbi:Galactan 1,3-beta-galactosidase [Penicillium ucsense]|uniref:Galactan 1,3-beta-galactosidase n=1 Tax=Penicillium ucsense TaxID=2839758 RepID=A0A8J8WJW9_9EURO|nr:Galactan 1,3-beta-galactosidase [Penicillium ucsense]KAF7736295.1 Galactan 1,3-beta-galactosidase [Penicillium ucsense]